jgi:hypothetical protein
MMTGNNIEATPVKNEEVESKSDVDIEEVKVEVDDAASIEKAK